jgi:DNA-binding beta-propeller fold protein YncE
MLKFDKLPRRPIFLLLSKLVAQSFINSFQQIDRILLVTSLYFSQAEVYFNNLNWYAMKAKLFITSVLILVMSLSLTARKSPSLYKISNRIALPGNGGWDYLAVDEPNSRLFVSHGNVVQVVDLKTNSLTGTIDDTKGVHGIAFANELKKGYISNGKDNSVTVFDLKTLEKLAVIPVTGINPDAILYDALSRNIFVFNGRTANATVIDATIDKVRATIPLDGKPEFSQADGQGRVFVNIEDKNEVTVINSGTLKVEMSWSLSPGEEPTGLALDPASHRLFAVCSNELMVVLDAESGRVIAQLPIGGGCDGVVFDPGKKRIYSSNGEGTITVVQQGKGDVYTVLENFPTRKGARTIALDRNSGRLYLSTAEFEMQDLNSKLRPQMKPDSFSVLEIECLK